MRLLCPKPGLAPLHVTRKLQTWAGQANCEVFSTGTAFCFLEKETWTAALTSRSGSGVLANQVCSEVTRSASRTNRPCLPWTPALRWGQSCKGPRPGTAAHGAFSSGGCCSGQRSAMNQGQAWTLRVTGIAGQSFPRLGDSPSVRRALSPQWPLNLKGLHGGRACCVGCGAVPWPSLPSRALSWSRARCWHSTDHKSPSCKAFSWGNCTAGGTFVFPPKLNTS